MKKTGVKHPLGNGRCNVSLEEIKAITGHFHADRASERDGWEAVGDGCARACAGEGVGAPHDLVLALLLLALPHHDALDDGALLGREVRQVWHIGHGGRPRVRGPAARCGALPAARRSARLSSRRFV